MRNLRTLGVLLLPLLTFLLQLGAAPLFDVDEGAFSEATREMFERGDFLSTYLNGEHRFDKPILIYWLQALSVMVFGINEWAFRLPSALAACTWAYATWHFARQRFGQATGEAALVVAATTVGALAIGRAATADALLNMLLALTLFDTWRFFESGRKAPLWRAYMWMGLGILTKGPIAVIVPGAVAFLYSVSTRNWQSLTRLAFSPMGWLITLGIAAPWYIYQYQTHGRLFIEGFILKHNVQRFSGTLEGHSGSLFYYVLAIPLMMLPWTGPLLSSLRHVRADFNEPIRRFLWLWMLFVLVFFSLSGTKLPHYVLYGITPLFILIALHRQSLKNPLIHLVPASLLFLVLAGLPWITQTLAQRAEVPAYYRTLLTSLPPDATWLIAPGIALALWLLSTRQRAAAEERVWQNLSSAAALLAILLAGWGWPFVGNLLQAPTKAVAQYSRQFNEPVVLWGTTAPSASVYRQTITPRQTPAPGGLAIIRTEKLLNKPADVLFEQNGMALVRRHSEPQNP